MKIDKSTYEELLRLFKVKGAIYDDNAKIYPARDKTNHPPCDTSIKDIISKPEFTQYAEQLKKLDIKKGYLFYADVNGEVLPLDKEILESGIILEKGITQESLRKAILEKGYKLVPELNYLRGKPLQLLVCKRNQKDMHFWTGYLLGIPEKNEFYVNNVIAQLPIIKKIIK